MNIYLFSRLFTSPAFSRNSPAATKEFDKLSLTGLICAQLRRWLNNHLIPLQPEISEVVMHHLHLREHLSSSYWFHFMLLRVNDGH
jgi:hypothetical protein